MITVLRLAEELKTVNYRKWFYSRWSPPPDRSVNPVPVHTDPLTLLPQSPGVPGKGLALDPPKSPRAINLVERLRPMLGYLLGNLPVRLNKNTVIEQPVDGDRNDHDEKSRRGEKGAKPPWSISAKRPLRPSSEAEPGSRLASLDKPFPQIKYDPGMLSPHQESEACPVIHDSGIEDENTPGVDTSQPLDDPDVDPVDASHTGNNIYVSNNKRDANSKIEDMVTPEMTSADKEDEDDDEYDADDEGLEEEDDTSSGQSLKHQLSKKKESHEQHNTVREVMKLVEAVNAHAEASQSASNQLPEPTNSSPVLAAHPSSDSSTSSSEEEETSKPGLGSIGPQRSRHIQDSSAEQKEAVREVMQKVEAMMTNCGENGSEPGWVQALKMAEAQHTASNRQSVPRTSPVNSEESSSDSSGDSLPEETEDITAEQTFGPQDPEESAQQRKTVGEVMKKVDSMMTQDNSGKNGPEPMWMTALRQAQQMLPPAPQMPPSPQPLARYQLPHHITQPAGATTLSGQAHVGQLPAQAGTGAAPFAPGVQAIGHERNAHITGGKDQSGQPVMKTFNALLTPGISGPYAWQPPWFGAPNFAQQNDLGLQVTQPQPHAVSNHQHVILPPSPPPTVRPKRRHVNLSQSPNDTDARKRPRQTALQSTVLPGGACAPTTPSPLPAESSFIPVLIETEIEDVLTQGNPTCLGSGTFGQVLLKRRKIGGELVALKCLLDVQDHAQAYKEMVAEVRVMMAMQHRREFPKFVGVVDQTTFAIEFVGDPVTLKSSHLRGIVNNPPANMTTLGWIRICLDISRGLHALHEAGWSHSDLHTRNVMVWQDPNITSADNWAAKIIDLGLAGRIDDPPPPYQFSDNEKADCYRFSLHLAPEIIEGTSQSGISSDVYSLGQIFGVVSFKKPKLEAIESIYQDCCGAPEDRPIMESIITHLEGFQHDVVT